MSNRGGWPEQQNKTNIERNANARVMTPFGRFGRFFEFWRWFRGGFTYLNCLPRRGPFTESEHGREAGNPR